MCVFNYYHVIISRVYGQAVDILTDTEVTLVLALTGANMTLVRTPADQNCAPDMFAAPRAPVPGATVMHTPPAPLRLRPCPPWQGAPELSGLASQTPLTVPR